ncbi:MAG: hypothetical protein ACI9MR_000891 [Myxococcota bacterium]
MAGLSGCDIDGDADPAAPFVDALPTESLLLFDFPGADDVLAVTEGALETQALPLVGESSELHRIAQFARTKVHAALRLVLMPIVTAMDRVEPRLDGDDRAVWRFTRPADGAVFVMVVARARERGFTYSVWFRNGGATDEQPWRFRVSGSSVPAGAAGDFRGTLFANLNNDGDPRTSGVVQAAWQQIGAKRSIDVRFFDATPDSERHPIENTRYIYEGNRERGFVSMELPPRDINGRPSKDLLEDVRLVSRWTDRRGRTDLAATGGDVRLDGFGLVVQSECWQAPSLRVTYETTMAARPDEVTLATFSEDGDPETCAFATPRLAAVSDALPRPVEPARPSEVDARGL